MGSEMRPDNRRQAQQAKPFPEIGVVPKRDATACMLSRDDRRQTNFVDPVQDQPDGGASLFASVFQSMALSLPQANTDSFNHFATVLE
jgi:hypothetical protein